MNPELFSDPWAARWCAELNASVAYRGAAAEWEGGVALVMTAPEPRHARAVFLDSSRGVCREARAANEEDLAAAVYIFEAAPAIWRQLFTGGLAPVMALFSGKLRLTRGNLAALMPYAGAARELIATAGAVPARFPDD